jgi:hypothetical protein
VDGNINTNKKINKWRHDMHHPETTNQIDDDGNQNYNNNYHWNTLLFCDISSYNTINIKHRCSKSTSTTE